MIASNMIARASSMDGRMRRSGEAGFTLLEVIVSTAILAVVTLMAVAAITRSNQFLASEIGIADIDTRVNKAIDSIREELSSSGPSQVTTPITTTTEIEFKTATGVSLTGSVVWSTNAIKYKLRDSPSDPADGVDNNKNGVIDEKQIIRESPSGSSSFTVIADGITALSFDRASATSTTVTVQITATSRDPTEYKKTMSVSRKATITFRNQ